MHQCCDVAMLEPGLVCGKGSDYCRCVLKADTVQWMALNLKGLTSGRRYSWDYGCKSPHDACDDVGLNKYRKVKMSGLIRP